MSGPVDQSPPPWLKTACRVVVIGGLLNFAIFVAIACYLGGDAVNGKFEDGRYYLFGVRTASGHKVYTEVSQAVFDYSRWHVYSLFITWPFVMLAAFAQNRMSKRTGRK
jgi:hypothetical protein